MRHAVSSVTLALSLVGAVVAPAGLALAAPAAAPVLAAAPKKKCTIEDKRLRELSGIIATSAGFTQAPTTHTRIARVLIRTDSTPVQPPV